MFTGLVEEVGTVARIHEAAHGFRMHVRTESIAAGLARGASVAVDGVCLTAIESRDGEFIAEVSPETLECTNMGQYTVGTRVNLERPLAVEARLGGHFVQGHVDAVTTLRAVVEEGDFLRVTFDIPAGLDRFLVEKGSVAINGVSLTVAALAPRSFDVQLVPHTIEHTNLTWEQRPRTMNLEGDILGKYVARMLRGQLEATGVAALAGGGA